MSTRTGTSGSFAQLSSGAVTLANSKISAVDGTAFVDFSAANVLVDFLGWYLEVTDSAGELIGGYIKAAGTGETLGSELAPVFSNVDAGNWTETGAEWVEGDGIATATNCTGEQIYAFGVTISELVYTVIDVTITDGSLNVFTGGSVITAVATDVYAGYGTCESTSMNVYGASSADAVINSFSSKQVLTPSATGVTIVSTTGGTTYNWATKSATFDYNDASNYTYRITTSGA